MDDGPKSGHRQWLNGVRRRVDAGEVPSVRLSLNGVKGKGSRGANKVILRLKPKAAPEKKTYSKVAQQKKLEPLALPLRWFLFVRNVQKLRPGKKQGALQTYNSFPPCVLVFVRMTSRALSGGGGFGLVDGGAGGFVFSHSFICERSQF